jgi:hypothetical protein
MSRVLQIVMCLAALALGACGPVPNAHQVDPGGSEERRVAAALEHWPKPSIAGVRRPFAATVQLAAIKAESPGVFEYHAPRDFRMIVARPGKDVLFDSLMNWAGVTVLRLRDTIPRGPVEMLTSDIAEAFVLPSDLNDLRSGETRMIVSQRRGTGHRYQWIFDRATGQLLQTDVDLGFFDTLHIYFRGGYTPDGWPREVEFSRPARLYDVSLKFTQ